MALIAAMKTFTKIKAHENYPEDNTTIYTHDCVSIIVYMCNKL